MESLSYLNTFALIDSDYRVVACSEEHSTFANDGIDSLIKSMGDQDFFFSDILIDGQGNQNPCGLLQ